MFLLSLEMQNNSFFQKKIDMLSTRRKAYEASHKFSSKYIKNEKRSDVL